MMFSSFMANYQKVFAQNYIQDDTFFASAAILANICNGSSRIVGGMVYDSQERRI